ncbi:hypothetical protein S245_060892, partial [Arachis hypogaea]
AWDEIEIGAGACVDHPTLIGHHDYVDFVTYERSPLRFGVHVMTINLGQVGRMAWGRYLFIGDPNLTDTPCVKFGRDLLRISHVIRDFDGLESSLDAVASEAQLHSVVYISEAGSGFRGNAKWLVWPGILCCDWVSIGPLLCCDPILLHPPCIPLQTLEAAVTHSTQTGTTRCVYDRFADPSFSRSCGFFSSPSPTHFLFHITSLWLLCGKVHFRNFEDIRFDGSVLVDFGLLPAQRRVPVSGPFYRAFHYELGDFMMFKDNHGNEFHVMLDKGFRSMVAAYNIRHGAWLRAYYEGDGTLCISIRNLDGFRIVYPRPHSRSNFTAPTLSSVNPHRTGVLSRDVFHTGDVIPPFSIEYTPPTSPVRSNAFGSPQNSTNSLGCPVYFASTTSQASLILSASLSGFV